MADRQVVRRKSPTGWLIGIVVILIAVASFFYFDGPGLIGGYGTSVEGDAGGVAGDTEIVLPDGD